MTIHTEDLLGSILESLDRIEYIKAEDIPGLDLYMDQVTTLMGERLKSTLRNPKTDKILTKTMINNYTKNDLLPPPIKKKYTKDHVMLLIFIYYYKSILSISDIQALLGPLTERYFGKGQTPGLQDVYEKLFALEAWQVKSQKQDIMEKFKIAETLFLTEEGNADEMMQLFSFISMLSFDVYVKKLLIEKLIDAYADHATQDGDKRGKKQGKK